MKNVNEYALKYDYESDNNFSAACYNDLSLLELYDILKNNIIDHQSLIDWNITEKEYFEAISAAFNEKRSELTI